MLTENIYAGKHGYKAVPCPVCQALVVLDADATYCRCGRELTELNAADYEACKIERKGK